MQLIMEEWMFAFNYIPSMWWLLIAIAVLIACVWSVKTKNAVGVYIEYLYEIMYNFFSDILGDNEYAWIKTYITNMFFVILTYNFLALITDFIAPAFGYNNEKEIFVLAEYIAFATSDYHFTIAMATIGIVIMMWVQYQMMASDWMFGKKITQSKWMKPVWKTMNLLYEYVPVWWKNILSVERGKMSSLVYYPTWLLLKLFDIIISVFIGFLDIIGVLAKVVSLSFRLYGNMLSWTALLTVLVLGLSEGTKSMLWFEFPIIAPLILFAQWMLVSTIQAFVFPLLIAIFIKVARMSGEGQTEHAEAV
jgi:F0F1-type ATP synthase membrane subunit a